MYCAVVLYKISSVETTYYSDSYSAPAPAPSEDTDGHSGDGGGH